MMVFSKQSSCIPHPFSNDIEDRTGKTPGRVLGHERHFEALLPLNFAPVGEQFATDELQQG
jgi:hypothetical protein